MSDNSNLNLISREEETFERSLRPKNFSEVIGRELEKQNLHIMIDSARKRGKALDHILFYGPPGLGKTSFAHVIANEFGSNIYVTNGSLITKASDLASVLTSQEDYSILFIDEIHRLKPQIEEVLYPAMEDGMLDILIGKGASAKTLRIELPKITIIGATTKLAMLSGPLRDRFGMSMRLDFYSIEELIKIVMQKADMLKINIREEQARLISERSRMTSRIAIRILKRARDLALYQNLLEITPEVVTEVMRLLAIDSDGLDELDRSIIKSIYYNFDNKPVGLNSLSASVSEDQDTIENVHEPYLLKIGIISRTPRGRVLTEKGVKIALDLLKT